jgi:hypothetical protein
MDVSLNAGAELDDEIKDGKTLTNNDLFENPEANELPEMRDDVNLLAVLESRLVDLHYLADDIANTKGIDQGMAMEAERILPNVLGRPVGFYTKAPSATNLKISMEEIQKGIWALIAAAAIAVIAVIVKIIMWVRGRSGGGGAGATAGSGGGGKDGTTTKKDISDATDKIDSDIQKSKEAADALEEVGDTVDKLGDFARGAGITINDRNGKPVTYSSMDKIIEVFLTDDAKYEHAKKFLESRNPLFHDIIKSGPYTNMILDAGACMRALNSAIIDKISEVDVILKGDMGSGSKSDEMKHNTALDNDRLSKPIEIKFKGSMVTAEEIASKLSAERHRVLDVEVYERISFDKLFDKMAGAYKSKKMVSIMKDMKEIVQVMSDLEGKLVQMKDLAGNLSNDGHPGANTTGVAVRLRSAIMVLGKDVIGLGMLVQQLKYYVLHHDHLAIEAIGFGTEIVRKMTHEIKVGGGTVPKEWRELLAVLEGQNAGIRKAFYSF